MNDKRAPNCRKARPTLKSNQIMNNVWFACIVVEIDDEAVDASGLTIEDNARLFENLFPLNPLLKSGMKCTSK